MFVYSVRATTIKFFGVICVALAVLVTLIAFVPTFTEGTEPTGADGESAQATERSVRYERVKSAEDVVSFLGQFGWEVDAASVQTVEVTLPETFDKVFVGYNELQKRQGLDLSKYRGKNVTRYTCQVSNYNGSSDAGKVYANVLVYRNRVIGGDLCSADVPGFVAGFEG